MADAAPAHRRQ